MKIPRYCTTPLFYKTEMLILMLMLIKKRLKNLQCTTFYEKRDGIKRNTLFGKIKHCGIGIIDIGSKVFDATASCISRIVNLESTLQNSQKFLFMT